MDHPAIGTQHDLASKISSRGATVGIIGLGYVGLPLAVALATQGRPPVVSSRFAFLLVNLLWFTTAAAGTIPFLASPMNMELSDAVFESVSAVTTTGSTVLVGLDAMAPGILLWRSILQWMGGLGVKTSRNGV